MSEIPRARNLLRQALMLGHMDSTAERLVKEALRLMTRERQVRRAPAKYRRITAKVRTSIFRLSETDMTMAEIAQAVGVRNGGRISEVLNGKR